MSNGDQLELFARALLALALGGAVGLEREARGHEAGIRTAALVCLGAALFGQVSARLGDDRVAAGVVQGIGFLGAGVMFQRGSAVRGVTTAGTIWVVAAIGLFVAYDLWLTAVLSTTAVVIVLELAPLSARIDPRRRGSSAPPARIDDARQKPPGGD